MEIGCRARHADYATVTGVVYQDCCNLSLSGSRFNVLPDKLFCLTNNYLSCVGVIGRKTQIRTYFRKHKIHPFLYRVIYNNQVFLTLNSLLPLTTRTVPPVLVHTSEIRSIILLFALRFRRKPSAQQPEFLRPLRAARLLTF